MPVKTKKTASTKTSAEKPIGTVTHYYDKIGVGIIKLKVGIKIGELLRFKGKKAEFVQAVQSIQFNHKPIEKAPRGKEVGIKMDQKVQEGDMVFRATE